MDKLFYPLSKKVKKVFDDLSMDKNEEKFNQRIELIEKDLFNSMWE